MTVRTLWRPGLLILLAALMVLTLGSLPSARAADGPSDWEPTPLQGKVERIFTPQAGAVLAQSGDALFRSDDGASTWQAMGPLPPSPPQFRVGGYFGKGRLIAVDPTNPSTLYANGEYGLYRSQDGAATWDLVLRTSELTWHYFTSPDEHTSDRVDVRAIAVSPADPRRIYVALTSDQNEFQTVRSSDGGTSWQKADESTGYLCGWIVPIFQAHPTDASRLFRTAFCVASRHLRDSMMESRDQGVTWIASFNVDHEQYRQWAYIPNHLVGGSGAMPGRFYLAAGSQPTYGHDALNGATVFRSDDDTSSWSPVLSLSHNVKDYRTTEPRIRTCGLTYDPDRPDNVYVALCSLGPSQSQSRTGMGVRLSPNAGASWTGLGTSDIGAVNELALSLDGTHLYAATGQGLYRIRLAE